MILLSTYKIEIILKFKGQHSYFCIKFIALKGLIKYKYEIPYVDLVKHGQKLLLKLVKIETKNHQSVTEQKLSLNEVKYYINLLYEYKKIYSRVIQYLMKRLKVEKFSLNVNIGFNDVAITAILFGILNSLTSILIDTLLRNMTFNEIDIRSTPDFNKSIIDLNFNCIIIFNLVNIIIARHKILKIKKGGEVNVKPSYRRINADNYAKY